MARGGMLGSTGIVQETPSHFPTRLNTEIGEVAWVFAVGTYHLAAWMALCSEGTRGLLKALFFMMLNEVFFVMYGMKD